MGGVCCVDRHSDTKTPRTEAPYRPEVMTKGSARDARLAAREASTRQQVVAEEPLACSPEKKPEPEGDPSCSDEHASLLPAGLSSARNADGQCTARTADLLDTARSLDVLDASVLDFAGLALEVSAREDHDAQELADKDLVAAEEAEFDAGSTTLSNEPSGPGDSDGSDSLDETAADEALALTAKFNSTCPMISTAAGAQLNSRVACLLGKMEVAAVSPQVRDEAVADAQHEAEPASEVSFADGPGRS